MNNIMKPLPAVEDFQYHIGITGSRAGITEAQSQSFSEFLIALMGTEGPSSFYLHHGDCVGADAQIAEIAQRAGLHIIGHPPTDERLRAFFVGDATVAPEPYLKRNAAIVKASNVVVGFPKEDTPQKRGGTWWTIRHAETSRGTYTYVCLPDGGMKRGAEVLV